MEHQYISLSQLMAVQERQIFNYTQDNIKGSKKLYKNSNNHKNTHSHTKYLNLVLLS